MKATPKELKEQLLALMTGAHEKSVALANATNQPQDFKRTGDIANMIGSIDPLAKMKLSTKITTSAAPASAGTSLSRPPKRKDSLGTKKVDASVVRVSEADKKQAQAIDNADAGKHPLQVMKELNSPKQIAEKFGKEKLDQWAAFAKIDTSKKNIQQTAAALLGWVKTLKEYPELTADAVKSDTVEPVSEMQKLKFAFIEMKAFFIKAIEGFTREQIEADETLKQAYAELKEVEAAINDPEFTVELPASEVVEAPAEVVEPTPEVETSAEEKGKGKTKKTETPK